MNNYTQPMNKKQLITDLRINNLALQFILYNKIIGNVKFWAAFKWLSL